MSCPSDLRQHMLPPSVPLPPKLPRLLQLHDIFLSRQLQLIWERALARRPREHLSEINAVRKIIN